MPIGMPTPPKPGTRISISAAGGDVSGNAPDAPAKRQDPAAAFYQQWVNEIHNPPQAPPGATGAAAAGGPQQGPAMIPAQRTREALQGVGEMLKPKPTAGMNWLQKIGEYGPRQLSELVTAPLEIPGTSGLNTPPQRKMGDLVTGGEPPKNISAPMPIPGGKLWDVPMAMGADMARAAGIPEWIGGLGGIAIPGMAGKVAQKAVGTAGKVAPSWAGAMKPKPAAAAKAAEEPAREGAQYTFGFAGGPSKTPEVKPQGPLPNYPPDPRQRQFDFAKPAPVGKATYDDVTPAVAAAQPPAPRPNPAAIGAAPKMKPVGTKQASSGVQTAVKAPSAAAATATSPVAGAGAPKAPIGAQNMMDFVGQNWQRLPPQHRDQFMQLTNSWNSANAVGNEGAKQQAMSDMYDMVMRAVAGGGA